MAVYTGRSYGVLLGEYWVHLVQACAEKAKGNGPFDAQAGGEALTIGFRHAYDSFSDGAGKGKVFLNAVSECHKGLSAVPAAVSG